MASIAQLSVVLASRPRTSSMPCPSDWPAGVQAVASSGARCFPDSSPSSNELDARFKKKTMGDLIREIRDIFEGRISRSSEAGRAPRHRRLPRPLQKFSLLGSAFASKLTMSCSKIYEDSKEIKVRQRCVHRRPHLSWHAAWTMLAPFILCCENSL